MPAPLDLFWSLNCVLYIDSIYSNGQSMDGINDIKNHSLNAKRNLAHQIWDVCTCKRERALKYLGVDNIIRLSVCVCVVQKFKKVIIILLNMTYFWHGNGS